MLNLSKTARWTSGTFNAIAFKQNDAEHAKVTRAMRYDVLRRDNFHCVRCGRGKEDGVKLHVDHIVPVSRGGKSVMSNLQTLCEDCNCGKGNRYEE